MKSLLELSAARDAARAKISAYGKEILVCAGTNCSSGGGAAIASYLEDRLTERGLDKDIRLVRTGCFGLCECGPVVIVRPDGAFYSRVSVDGAREIFEEHILAGNIVTRLLYHDSVREGVIKPLEETDFFRSQNRVALRNCGVINPEDISEYIARGGYEALGKVLREMTPAEVVEEIKKSGLRGRGGAGFPTGVKWSFAAAQPAGTKYVCCNADEGDPGAFMDRSVLEGDPHSVIEAMAIAGYAIGAGEGYIYVRAEYPIAVKRVNIAINQAREAGFLGDNIFGTDFSFDITVRLGAGAFVCGEETALMTSIEGKRGEPRVRPPFPAVKGLFGKPTILNNVETLANIPQIIIKGAEWFAGMGTEKSPGTKVFALGGKIHNTGLVEIPMGTSLRTIVEEIGGGVPNGKRFKAAQTGGPSGGCIPADHLDVPIDYENLTSIGAMMGSGGLIILDEDACMVDIAKFFLGFTVDESCGKCTPCRIGTRRLYEILDRISKGKGELSDLDTLEELCLHLKSNSLCALGQTAPNPVLSTLRYFRDEYIEHVVDKRCRTGVCKELFGYTINADLCKGCTSCAKVCPAAAISGKVKAAHVIDQEKCLRCGACVDRCKFGAITKG